MLSGQVGRIFFSRMSEDDDVLEAAKRFADEATVKGGVLILIGALKKAVLGCYKDGLYQYTEVRGPVEVVSCVGNISQDEEGQTVIHAHLVVSKENGEAFGGHLMKGCQVGPTVEIAIIEAEGVKLTRAFDEKTKLKLLKLG